VGWTCVELYGLPASDEQRLYVTLSSLKKLRMEVFAFYARDRGILISMYVFDRRAWLKRENLASYKKFRKDFNEQVRYLLYFQACCLLK